MRFVDVIARKRDRHALSREEIESSLVGRFPDIRGYIGRPELVWGTVVMAATPALAAA